MATPAYGNRRRLGVIYSGPPPCVLLLYRIDSSSEFMVSFTPRGPVPGPTVTLQQVTVGYSSLADVGSAASAMVVTVRFTP